MKTLRYYLKIYAMFASQYIKARAQYRVDFMVGLIGMIFTRWLQLVFIGIVFTSIPQIKGWNFHEMIFMYGFMLLACSVQQLLFENIYGLNGHVMRGTFIKYYLRPLNMLFYYITEIFDLKGIGQLLTGAAACLYALVSLQVHWSLLRILLFIVLLLNGSLIMISIQILAGSVGFWVRGTLMLLTTVHKLRDVAGYPLTIFGIFLRFLFTFIIPIGFIAFYPVQILLRPQATNPLLYASPLFGIAFFCLAYAVWKRGVNAYSGTGT